MAEHYGGLVRVRLDGSMPGARSQIGRGIWHVRDVVAAENLTPIT